MSESESDVFETPEETLPVEWVAREDLIPNDWNPNDMIAGKREELVHSILDNGWTQPIVRKDGTDQIVDGEQRWHASGDDRIKEDESLTPDGVPAGHVPVFDLAADETQARVASLQMNVATGEHDADKLGEILSDFDEEGVLEETTERMNMDEISVDRLIERVEPPEEEADPDELWDIPWDEEDSGMTTRLDLLVTENENDRVMSVLGEDFASTFVRLCEWAKEHGVDEIVRVEDRQTAGKDPVFDPSETDDIDVEADR